MQICKNCGGKLIVKSTKKTPEQVKKAFYYTAYYYCPDCKKLYHDEKFKIVNTPLPDLFRDAVSPTKHDVEIWTDGACVNNGKPNAKASWAFVSGKKEAAGLVEGLQTNNRGEALAIYHALVWAAEKGYRSVKLHTDSQISIHGVTKDPQKVLKNREIFEQIAQVVKGSNLRVEYVKVLGHSGNPNNDRVDKLANDLARTG